jgi:hypothetical protein
MTLVRVYKFRYLFALQDSSTHTDSPVEIVSGGVKPGFHSMESRSAASELYLIIRRDEV